MNCSSKPKKYANHTSVSLKQRHFKKLLKAETEHGFSANEIMILLLRYMNERAFTIVAKRERVKYQLPEGDIQIVNLYVEQRDYERNLDTRRFAKVSVSWLLAYAIDHFLDIILRKIYESIDCGKEILNNYIGPQTFSVKKLKNRIRMVSIWYPQRE